MDEQPNLSSEARVTTAMPGRYLAQLCKHFDHKLPVTLAGDRGRIEFSGGVCALEAGDDTLTMRLGAGDEAALARLEDVIAGHLLRFALREKPAVQWTRAP